MQYGAMCVAWLIALARALVGEHLSSSATKAWFLPQLPLVGSKVSEAAQGVVTLPCFITCSRPVTAVSSRALHTNQHAYGSVGIEQQTRKRRPVTGCVISARHLAHAVCSPWVTPHHFVQGGHGLSGAIRWSNSLARSVGAGGPPLHAFLAGWH